MRLVKDCDERRRKSLGFEGCGHQTEMGADLRLSFPAYKDQILFQCICLLSKLYYLHFVPVLNNGFSTHDAVNIDIGDKVKPSTVWLLYLQS